MAPVLLYEKPECGDSPEVHPIGLWTQWDLKQQIFISRVQSDPKRDPVRPPLCQPGGAATCSGAWRLLGETVQF